MASKRAFRKTETHFNIMRLLEGNPNITTRKIAQLVGISNGAAHYCVTALIDKGFVKLDRFARSKTKPSYIYELTTIGIKAKAKLTVRFLELKREEYNYLKREIESMEREIFEKENALTDGAK